MIVRPFCDILNPQIPLRWRNHVLLTTLCAAWMISQVPQHAFAQAGHRPVGTYTSPAKGPLTVHPTNPRYFTDGSGKAIYLAGSHTWGNLQDYRYESKPFPPSLDFEAYLDFQKSHNLNFFRLWAWENAMNKDALQSTTWYDPLPFERHGSENALDGQPKFDLTKFNQAYFDRMRYRVATAQQQGIYVSVMLFQGLSVESKGNIKGDPILGHYLNPKNNLQGVGADTTMGLRSVARGPVIETQEAYLRKVIDTVNDLDNVLYEITNEDTGSAANTEWQYHIIRFIQDYEKTKPKQHPVGMTVQQPNHNDETLFKSPATWISPDARYAGSDGTKVVVNDTDHSFFWIYLKRERLTGQVAWVWINFTGGNNLLFMDPYLDPSHDLHRNFPKGSQVDPYWDLLRDSLGRARSYAVRMDLAAMTPHDELATTKHCLANPGQEYLLYIEDGGETEVDLSAVQGKFAVEWMNPDDGVQTQAEPIEGGAKRKLKAPFKRDAVLYIRKAD